MRLVAALLTVVAVGLVTTRPAVAPAAGVPRAVPRLLRGSLPVGFAVGGAGALAAVVAGARGRHLVLVLLVLATAAGIATQVRRARRWRHAERRQRHVVEVCEALVGELRAGQPVTAGLEHCAELWPDLRPVVDAGRLGADVPAALRRLARSPGAEGLHDVASAWLVSERSGAGLAGALGQVAATARSRQSTRHLVHGELASAQATARLVAVLPFGALAMSSGLGGDPWRFLLATPAGLACLAAGLASAFVGLWWIDRIAAGVLRA